MTTAPTAQYFSTQKNVTTVATALAPQPTNFTNGIVIECLQASTAPVYIGNSSVTAASGFEIAPGASLQLPNNITDASQLYAIAAANSTTVISIIAFY